MRAVAFAEDALRASGASAQTRVWCSRQAAIGYALAGDASACERRLADAYGLLDDESPPPPWAGGRAGTAWHMPGRIAQRCRTKTHPKAPQTLVIQAAEPASKALSVGVGACQSRPWDAQTRSRRRLLRFVKAAVVAIEVRGVQWPIAKEAGAAAAPGHGPGP
jgi:hypothetical protein